MAGAMPIAGTALLTVTLLTLAAACGASEQRADPPDPAAATTAAPTHASRARLLPEMGAQFRVRGSGFKPRERVRVTVTRTNSSVGVTRRVRATGRGTFALAFSGVQACGGVEGVAAGSRGSHASFQFSSLTC